MLLGKSHTSSAPHTLPVWTAGQVCALATAFVLFAARSSFAKSSGNALLAALRFAAQPC